LEKASITLEITPPQLTEEGEGKQEEEQSDQDHGELAQPTAESLQHLLQQRGQIRIMVKNTLAICCCEICKMAD
jgi:hypothetical protein